MTFFSYLERNYAKMNMETEDTLNRSNGLNYINSIVVIQHMIIVLKISLKKINRKVGLFSGQNPCVDLSYANVL